MLCAFFLSPRVFWRIYVCCARVEKSTNCGRVERESTSKSSCASGQQAKATHPTCVFFCLNLSNRFSNLSRSPIDRQKHTHSSACARCLSVARACSLSNRNRVARFWFFVCLLLVRGVRAVTRCVVERTRLSNSLFESAVCSVATLSFVRGFCFCRFVFCVLIAR